MFQNHVALTIWVSLALSLLLGCGDGSVSNTGRAVGGPCSSDSDCKDQCLTSVEFPSGTCAIACDSGADCPDGSYCISSGSGVVCLLSCTATDECRTDYTCTRKDDSDGGFFRAVCLWP